jgi:hypothetical protein
MGMSSGVMAPSGPPVGSVLRPALDDAPPARGRTPGGGPWRKVAIFAVIAVVVAGGGKAVWDKMNRTHIQAPPAIAGVPRIDDPELARSVRELENIAEDNGTTGKAGFYGTNGAPSFFFAAFEYRPSGDQSPDDIFSEFSGGFATGGTEAVIDLRTKTTDTIEEATFVCARLRGRPAGSICMWADKDIVGFVGAFGQGITKAHDLTAVVRTSVES